MSKKQRLFVPFGNNLPYSFVEMTVQSPVTCETQFRSRMEMAMFDLSGFNPALKKCVSAEDRIQLAD
jgi:hypothetical protein